MNAAEYWTTLRLPTYNAAQRLISYICFPDRQPNNIKVAKCKISNNSRCSFKSEWEPYLSIV